MKKLKYIIPILITAIIVSSCDLFFDSAKSDFSTTFSNCGIYINGKNKLRFEEDKHQMVQKVGGNGAEQYYEYRIQSDDQTEMLVVKLPSGANFTIGELIKATITTKGISDVRSSINCTLEVTDVDNKNIWLWEDIENIGIILPIVE